MERVMFYTLPVMVAVLLVIGWQRAQTEQPIPASAKTVSAVTEANNDFGFRLFSALTAEQAMNGKNVIISPVSISQALCMTYNGAAGNTKTGMENTLGLSGLSLEAINAGQAALLNNMASADAKVTTKIANALWVKDGYELNADFVQRNVVAYQAEVSTTDVTSPAGVAHINEWVSGKTEKMIPKLLSDNDVNANTRLILTNAVYFHGQWTAAFDEQNTSDAPFTLEDGTTLTTSMMRLKSSLRYNKTPEFQAVRLPYGDGRMSMYLFLPAKGKSLADLLPQLTAANWQQWMKGFNETTLTVELPRFKAGYKASLNEPLKAMGMSDAFSEMDADFSAIPKDGRRDLYISKVVHEALLEVQEKGTRAAAATGVIMSKRAMVEEIILSFNRPFFFTICDDENGTVLFLGKISRPEKL